MQPWIVIKRPVAKRRAEIRGVSKRGGRPPDPERAEKERAEGLDIGHSDFLPSVAGSAHNNAS
jgi:hypothetical protein